MFYHIGTKETLNATMRLGIFFQNNFVNYKELMYISPCIDTCITYLLVIHHLNTSIKWWQPRLFHFVLILRCISYNHARPKNKQTNKQKPQLYSFLLKIRMSINICYNSVVNSCRMLMISTTRNDNLSVVNTGCRICWWPDQIEGKGISG